MCFSSTDKFARHSVEKNSIKAHSQSVENLAFVDIGFSELRNIDPNLTSFLRLWFYSGFEEAFASKYEVEK